MVGVGGESNHTYIRNINTTSVSGAGTDTVTVNLSTGLIGHLSSSRRHKEDIQPMTDSSETLYRLKPVTYRYKKEIDVTPSLDYGLVAEEVAAVDPNLVACNKDGQIETVRYTAVNAMLLNEFLKEHRAFVEEKGKVERLEQQVAALTAGLQKVSAEVETSRAARRTAANNH
jgi:Chaperone of endosialidase